MSRIVEEANRQKLAHALEAVYAVLERLPLFDPARNYTYTELEIFDALTSRFIRAYESAIGYFRTYDQNNAMHPADTLRDLLHNMEKAGYITSTDCWLDMRLVRNKISHDYVPEQMAGFISLINGPFASELKKLQRKINNA